MLYLVNRLGIEPRKLARRIKSPFQVTNAWTRSISLSKKSLAKLLTVCYILDMEKYTNKKYWLNKAFVDNNYKFTSTKVTYEEFLTIIAKKEYNLKQLNISAPAISKMLKRIFPDRQDNSKI